MKTRIPEPWEYKGVMVIPVAANSAGIRWCANMGAGMMLKADTKAGIRQLISERLTNKTED